MSFGEPGGVSPRTLNAKSPGADAARLTCCFLLPVMSNLEVPDGNLSLSPRPHSLQVE